MTISAMRLLQISAILATGIGVFVRLYLLPQQILLDDEWHALNYVLDKSFLELSTRFGLGANSSFQNMYSYLLLHTVGWSELLLRLPSVVCGLLSLFLFPHLVSRLWGPACANVFLWLLAISPCLTFYSRLTRPFSVVAFFGFLSFLSATLWIRGQRRYRWVYALAAVAAMYAHLYSTIVVLAPMLSLGALYVYGRIFSNRYPLPASFQLPPFREAFFTGALIVTLSALFVAPPVLANPWILGVVNNTQRATAQTYWGLLSLWSGTASSPLMIVFALLAAFGLRLFLRNWLFAGLSAVTAIFLVLLNMMFSTQEGAQIPLQWARYGISLFPVFLLLVAVAGVRVYEWVAARTPARFPALAIPVLILASLLFTSPLPKLYGSMNNFTSHAAIQESYEDKNWHASPIRAIAPLFQVQVSDIPRYYFDIAKSTEPKGLIEGPMMIGDHYNLLHYYQVFHGKPVRAGYFQQNQIASLPTNDNVFGNTPIDYVMSRVPPEDRNRMHFRNMVALDDIAHLRAHYTGWHIVVHLMANMEGIAPKMTLEQKTADPLAQHYAAKMEEHFGQPIYKDPLIAVWEVK